MISPIALMFQCVFGKKIMEASWFWFLKVKKICRKYWIACSLAFLSLFANGQKADSSEGMLKAWLGDAPRKATIFSAVLPGSGQAYNGSYWKIPIIYAGIGGLLYSSNFNHGEYRRFSEYYKFATDDDPNTEPEFPASAEQLRQRRNYYKKYRDLSLIGLAGLYAIQILDAHIEAHLNEFDVSDDLSVGFAPTMIQNQMSLGFSPGLRIQMTF